MTASNDPYLQQAIDDHAQLQCLVTKITEQLDKQPPAHSGDPAAQSLIDAITRLSCELRAHFMREEEGGYLEEALVRMPQLASRAASLQQQHADFSEQMRYLAALARSGALHPDGWLDLRQRFHRFASQLEKHELAENLLLQRAFNTDLEIDA